jgi:hypothetical protein
VLYGLLPYFSESFGENLQRQTRPFPCDNTLRVRTPSMRIRVCTNISPHMPSTQAVADVGVECPPVTQELVAHFLASLGRRGLLPPATGAYTH